MKYDSHFINTVENENTTRIIEMGDVYDYNSISVKSKQYAIDNLNEDPVRVNEHIDNLRRWAQEMPHLTCPTDSRFLLRFLRVAKFDENEAKKLLDNFCTLRCSTKGIPHFYDRSTIDEAIIDEFLDSGHYVPLGTNEEGELFILLMTSVWDPERIPVDKWTKIRFLIDDVLLEQEHYQIHELWIFVDFTNASKKVAEACTDNDFLKNVAHVLQDGAPWRFKGAIFYNASKKFDAFAKIWSYYQKDVAEVVKIAKNEQDKIDKFPGLRNLLPTECGGRGGPLKSIAEKFKHQFKADYETYFKDGQPRTTFCVDESKRHHEISEYYEKYSEYDGPQFDPECSD